jgi:hypothetical protein
VLVDDSDGKSCNLKNFCGAETKLIPDQSEFNRQPRDAEQSCSQVLEVSKSVELTARPPSPTRAWRHCMHLSPYELETRTSR